MNDYILIWLPVVFIVVSLAWYFWLMFTETEWWENRRNKNIEGKKSKAFCQNCGHLVDVTFFRRDVPLSDGSDVIKNILVGVCDQCDTVISIPHQSILKHMTNKSGE